MTTIFNKNFSPCIVILGLLLLFMTPGCSYLSDMVEGSITNRAGFSIDAYYDGTDVDVTWDETGSSDNFAGFEIYITEYPNDEFVGYDLVASRHTHALDALENGYTGSFTHENVDVSLQTGIYFYRVGIIHWDEDEEDRTEDNGYFVDTDEIWEFIEDNDPNNYNGNTEVNLMSGSAIVDIY